MAGSYIGGTAAAAYGWRGALAIAAMPGVLLALLIALTLPEPQRGAFEENARKDRSASGLGEAPAGRGALEPHALIQGKAPFRTAVALVLKPGGFRSSFAAIVAASVVSIGIMSWFAVVLIRVHGLGLRQAGLASALAGGLLGGLGSLSGGWWANRVLAGRSAALLKLCAWGMAISIPCGLFGLYANTTSAAIAGLGLWSFFASIYMGPSYGVCLGTVPAQLRSTLMAVVVVACNLVGAAGGPQIAGVLSDALHARGDALALPHALSVVLLFGVVPVALFWRASKSAEGVPSVSTAA
jgi:predicted MFS family arabinose efflux permease